MKSFLVIAVLCLCATAFGERLRPHIIGGGPASIGAWPWQGSLQRSTRDAGYWGHTCGCSLISSTWVITAAHCVGSFGLTVVMGLHQRGNPNIGAPETYQISQIYKHGSFNPSTLVNDIALIKLRSAVSMNQYVSTIPMAPSGANFDNQWCYISGWGVTTIGGGNLATTLQQANVQVYTQSFCKQYWNIGGGHICLGVMNQKGACNGDSGGPLQCMYNGQYHLAGLTSFGTQGCYTNRPSVYTRVSYYRNWIRGISGL